MVKILFFILISFSAWSQFETPSMLEEDLKRLNQQLVAQEARTKVQRQRVLDAKKKLQEYQGNGKGKTFLESALATEESNLQFAIKGEEDFKVLIQMNREKKDLPKYSAFTNCNANTPEINLENETPYAGATFKGAFHNVPRDNQDGLGTCFANTAKNLLVGLTDGKEVASFIDMAVQIQSPQKLLTDGLDGGNSCETLKKIEEVGYCPQNFSPMETGERNYFTESLFHHEPLLDLSQNVNILKDFLRGVEKFKFVAKSDEEEVLNRAKIIVDKVKANPNVQIPLPIVRVDIPSHSELYRIHDKKKLSVPFEDFLSEYRDGYKKFYPVMIKGILQGKNPKKIFDLYKVSMNDFIQKYNLKSELGDFRKTFLYFAERDFQEPQFLDNFKKSLQFMKEISGRSSDSDEAFADYCGTSGSGVIGFLNTLSPIIQKLQTAELNSDVLFDGTGKLKDVRDLMQLLVAPKCLGAQNRKPLGMKLYCQDGYYAIRSLKNSDRTPAEKVKALREKVVMSLVQGLPLGNAFPVNSTVSHINTITGLRFNSQKNQCEYLIRESQTGTSSWLPEQQIFDKIHALTEVRRR